MSEEIERRVAFNGGIFSPWTDPRIDLEKYRSACRQLENMRPSVYGGAFSRPGTVYLGAAKNASKPCRLVEFEFSVTTTLVLEFGEFYIRFWTTGASPALVDDPDNPGTPYEIPTPWDDDEIMALQFAQQNDVIWVTHPDHLPRTLSRYANAQWQIAELVPEWPATLGENPTRTTISITGGTVGTPGSYTAWTIQDYDVGDKVSYLGQDFICISPVFGFLALIAPGVHKEWRTYWKIVDQSVTFGIGQEVGLVASEDLFEAGHVGTIWVIKQRRPDPSVKLALNATAGAASDELAVLGEWSASVQVNTGGTWESNAVVERSYDLITWEPLRSLSSSGVQSGTITGTELEPAFLRVKLIDKTGSPPSSGSFVIEAVDADQYGLAKITAVTDSENADAILLFPVYNGDATARWEEPAWSDVRGYPRTVAIHENRLMFAGTSSRTQTVWGSVIDDYTNFRTGSDDDLGLSFTLASDAANGIQWIVSQESLVIGTTGSEWALGARENDKTLTPSNAAAKRNTLYGSAHIQARAVHDATLFVQRSGRKVREFVYAFERDGFVAQDLTLLAENVTEGGITQIAVQKNPETVVWFVTGDGELVGLTYERGQNVAGWFLYTTDGTIESAAVVTGAGEEDELWISVVRTINGSTVRYIERFKPDQILALKAGEQASLVCSDSSVTYSGAATDTITGLGHLEGESVAVLADGAPHANVTVSGGAITLQFEAETVVAGLPFTPMLEPTYLETNDPGSLSKVGKKRITRALIEVWQTLGLEMSADGGTTWDAIEFRDVADFMDQAPPLFSGIKEQYVMGASDRQVSIMLRQTQPLPLNVLSLHLRYELNAV